MIPQYEYEEEYFKRRRRYLNEEKIARCLADEIFDKFPGSENLKDTTEKFCPINLVDEEGPLPNFIFGNKNENDFCAEKVSFSVSRRHFPKEPDEDERRKRSSEVRLDNGLKHIFRLISI